MGDNKDKKTILIEKLNSLDYIKESGTRDGKNYLGRLVGPGASFTKPTRNDRRYPLELWRNIENSASFKEGMDTLTIFGEADHPTDRIDTYIKEIAIVLTKYEIRESEGIVWTEFDILDTPNGRILKELLDYGSKIGVSSRGLGEEIQVNGETIIDPDSYIFYAFDAVVLPAVESARPEYIVESLTESFISEINNATTPDELLSIKKIAESVKIPDLEVVKESIDNKLDSYKQDISINKFEEELSKLVVENKDLKSKLTANNIRVKDIRNLFKNTKYNSRSMRKSFQESLKTINELEEEIINNSEHIDDIYIENDKLFYEHGVLLDNRNYLRSMIMEMREEIDTLMYENKNLSESIGDMSEEIEELSEQINLYKSNNNDLIVENDTLRDKLKDSKLKLHETQYENYSNIKLLEKESKNKENIKILKSKLNDSNNKISKLNKILSETMNEYIKLKCIQEGLNYEDVKQSVPDDITLDKVNESISYLSKKKIRLNKVPINYSPISVSLNENMSDEDRQTMSILTGNSR